MTSSPSALATPMMQQYLAIKAKHPDAIVLYRMGDFYEMFLRDAELAAPLLDIALTTRDKGKPDAVPMCGVPVHSADAYVRRLAELGHRVAICEQVEDPASRGGGRRLVRREVVEVVTPGLVGDPDAVDAAREVSLVCVAHPRARGGDAVRTDGRPARDEFGLAVLDASTGDLRATRAERAAAGPGAALPAALRDELLRIAPREILLGGDAPAELEAELAALLPAAARARVPEQSYRAIAPDALRLDPSLEASLVATTPDAGTEATRALLGYLAANQPFALRHVSRLRRYALSDAMLLDAATRGHLELFESAEDRSRRGTLVERVDLTLTPPGARRLARWLGYPLVDPAAIAARQDAVAWLAERDRVRGRLRAALRAVRDLERLLAKAARPGATPRELVALRASLEALPGVVAALAERDDESLPALEAPRPAALPVLLPVPEAARLVADCLVDEPPALLRGSRGAGETGFVREGHQLELDGLRERARKGREWIAGLEARERERTGVAALRIRHHPVHGYGIEITKANAGRVPADYERKQTLANAERFTTPELREMERSVAGAHERAAALERELFEAMRQGVLGHAIAIREAASAVGELDALQSLAEVARRDGWVRPVVDASERLEITAGRHPVVEAQLALRGESPFVPNDTTLDPEGAQILLLTGPNMSGKSTYLRQVALLVLLAQAGSYVPAERARIGVVDRVFTRVGASDRLARGESTFMVEMRETAQILAQASRRSLVILDEIGRGTSTFDGLSIAWAVAEHLHDAPALRCRTLFATHYHELAELADTKARVRNAHFEAREWGDDVVFLRRLAAGAASHSYGIQVARLAGLPAPVIARARELLRSAEGEDPRAPALARRAIAAPAPQLALFGDAPAPPGPSPAEREALAALRSVEPLRTTPLEALALLDRLSAALREERGKG
jgi:DNA mismatch repair protein MutS